MRVSLPQKLQVFAAPILGQRIHASRQMRGKCPKQTPKQTGETKNYCSLGHMRYHTNIIGDITIIIGCFVDMFDMTTGGRKCWNLCLDQ